MRLEDRNGLAGLNEEGLIVPEPLERCDNLVECVPGPGRLPGPAVDDELVGSFRVLKVVLEHPEDRFLPPALASQPIPPGGLDSFHGHPRKGCAGKGFAATTGPRRGP